MILTALYVSFSDAESLARRNRATIVAVVQRDRLMQSGQPG